MGLLIFRFIIIVSVLVTLLIIFTRKVTFSELMVAKMAVLMALAFDMIVCKQLHMYAYVDKNFNGINTFFAGLLIYPSISIMFTNFLPKKKNSVIIYIILWVMVLTTFELLVSKPYGVVIYPKWDILPWSGVVYVITFSWLTIYLKLINKYVK